MFFFIYDHNDVTDPKISVVLQLHSGAKSLQESCAIAKMTAQCALHMGALKIFGTP